MPEDHSVINLSHFLAEFFRNAVRAHVAEYRAYYADRLASVYIRGSVHRNEAVPGISDLDIIPFIWDEFTETDRSFWKAVRDKLEPEYPGTKLGWACPVETMRTIESLQSVLKHDATLIYGCDLVGEMDPPVPDYFNRVWLLVRFLSGVDEEDRSQSSIPNASDRRYRKLARLTVTAAGGFLLAEDELHSYRAVDVLPRVLELCPEFQVLLSETSKHYDRISPTTDESVGEFEAQFLAFTAWVGGRRATLNGLPIPAAVESLSRSPEHAPGVIASIPEAAVKLPGRN